MAKDKYHNLVKDALIADGWTVTDDPLYLDWYSKYQVDIGAEKLIVARKEKQKIAVEVKTFLKSSFTHEFHSVLGQYLSYLLALKQTDENRVLYLAVPLNIWETEFQEKGTKLLVKHYNIKLIIYDVENKIINKWIL